MSAVLFRLQTSNFLYYKCEAACGFAKHKENHKVLFNTQSDPLKLYFYVVNRIIKSLHVNTVFTEL
jgi:hypothetical protein